MILRRNATVAMTLALAYLWAGMPMASAKEAKKSAPDRAFIESSLISAPKRQGDFVLEQSLYDPDNKHSGAAFRYIHPDHEAVRLDIFVYPAGEMPADQALERGMDDFIRSFDAGVQMKYYHDLTITGRERFDIVPAPSNAISKDTDMPPALRAALMKKPIEGERLDLRYRIHIEDTGENVMMRSRGYLFYKKLYFFKGRISAAETLVDQATYNALTDRAMRELVQAIEVRNVGSCARNELTIYGGGLTDENMEKEISRQIGASLSGQAAKSCYDTTASARSIETRDVEVVTIEYEPDDWKSK